MPRAKKQTKGICLVPACEKEATTLGMCNACYARTYYWHKKSLKQKMNRLKQINVWESSLELQCGNVHAFDRERLKRQRKAS